MFRIGTIILSLSVLLMSSCQDDVYICTGRSSKCFHDDPDCRGLSNCGGTVKEVSKEYAEDMGRRPCRICY